MLRSDAPSVVAILGVGLVMLVTGSAGPVRSQETARAPLLVETARPLLVVEDRDRLARFTVPHDRLALAPTTGAVVRAPLGFDGQPALVALVASWCAPCAAELPVALALAERAGLRLVLVSLDEVAGPESLRAVIEDLFARAERTSRALPAVELRADPDGAWTTATAPLLTDGDPDALPQSLLFAGDGVLLALAQGALEGLLAARFETHLQGGLR